MVGKQALQMRDASRILRREVDGQLNTVGEPMHWHPMTPDEYAALQLALGAKLVKAGNVWWRRIRPMFYRPLLYYEPLEGNCILPPIGWLGAYQYAVPNAAISNSTLDFLVLDGLPSYDIAQLEKRKRWLIRQAAKTFSIRPISEASELKHSGHPVYVSFYERTRYTYMERRCRKPVFDRWAETIFEVGKPLVLGGYENGNLKGVSVSYRVRDTLIYSTVFVETGALKRNLGDLMFHEFRVRAAQETEIRRVILRPYHGGNSLDSYYLFRGAKLVRQPARVNAAPFLLTVLKMFFPRHHAALMGDW